MDTEADTLVSPRFLKRLTFGVAVLACLTVAISIGGRKLGEHIALAGHTEDRAVVNVLIGQDLLRLPANAIRFEDQRTSGPTDRIDLYLTWPEMEGYTAVNRSRFNDVASPESLIFAQLSQSTMSRDMSGRVEPIYSHLFDGVPEKAPAGLTLRRLKASSGYEQEVLLTAPLPDGSTYAVRCILPGPDHATTSADCQRDIHIGDDLSLIYRFSSRLLPQWQAMEQAIRTFASGSLAEKGHTSPSRPEDQKATETFNQ
ncbi:hypothetical protein GGQ64_000146 [Rhizobium azooxidifex]|uniref:Transmembrane anchored protein n=1 Tax=Mycoplana azooxidifex TaxID=1636188 RepID=A0A7W6D662_9HYPH|nr:hypothetical protein [Mycoplana azooxidifex]MBB3974970.1 hypothetical protein [Mycoplana azooxidifex]